MIKLCFFVYIFHARFAVNTANTTIDSNWFQNGRGNYKNFYLPLWNRISENVVYCLVTEYNNRWSLYLFNRKFAKNGTYPWRQTGNINRLPLSLTQATSLSWNIIEENKDKDNWNVRHMNCTFFPQYKNRDLILSLLPSAQFRCHYSEVSFWPFTREREEKKRHIGWKNFNCVRRMQAL